MTYISGLFENIKKNPLYEKSIVLIGDSLCYGQSYSGAYGAVLKELNPDTTVYNYSIGGSQLGVIVLVVEVFIL